VKIILDSTGAAGLVVVLVTAITGAFAIGSERVAADLVAGVTLFVSNNVIINYSTIKGHRISVKIPLPSGQDLDKAIRVVTEAIQGFSPKLDPQEFPASVVFESAAYGYAYMDIHAYTLERLDYGPEKSRLFMLAANALKNAGIKFSN
jgi:small-conductance mechanosensitive channel